MMTNPTAYREGLTLIDKIRAIIEPTVEDMKYHLVQIRLFDKGEGRTLQIMAERHDEENMTVDDCSEISYAVSALLDVSDPIPDAYQLEISSPGIDRPLTRPEDYEKYQGKEAKIETVLPIEGRKRFKGIIRPNGDEVEIMVDGQLYLIPHENINTAKLVLTDELIREHLRRGKQREKNREIKE